MRRYRAAAALTVAGVAVALLQVGVAQAVAATTWSPQLTRYPWLTDVTPTSARVTWASSVSSTGTVTWGPVGSCTGFQATATRKGITVNGVGEQQYAAAVTGLSPATAYCYRVYVGTTTRTDLLGADPSPTFRTLPGAASTAPVTFAVIGDWGDTTTNGLDPGDTTNGVNPEQAAVMSRLATSGAQFVVSTADVAYPSGNDTNYGDLNQTGKDVSAVFAPSFYKQVGATIPMFATMGNHGLSQTILQNWPEQSSAAASGGTYGLVDYPSINGSTPVSSPSSWYAVQAGNVRVYLLDAAWQNGNVPTGTTMYQMDHDAHWTIGSAEWQWLAADLAAHPGGIKFAVFHFPLHSDNATESTDTWLDGPAGLEGLLSRYDVAAAFNGHAHLYQRNLPQPGLGRMVSYVTGGGGGRLEPIGKTCSPTDAYGIGWSYSSIKGSRCGAATVPTSPAQVFHFLLVTVSGTKVTVSPTSASGAVFDAQQFAYPADTTAPTTPTGLQGTVASSTEVDLRWTAGTDDIGVVSYDIVRDGQTIGHADGTATTYADTTVTAGTTHAYAVVARDAAGNASPPSAPVSVTTPGGADTTPPTAPGNLSAAAAGPNEVDLSWTASTDAVGVTAYEVSRDGALVATLPGGSTGYADTAVSPATTYAYSVAARDAAGNRSSPSGPASVTTPSATPPPLFADGFESGDMSSWTSNSGIVVQNRVVAGGAWAAEQVSTGAATSAQRTVTSSPSVYYRMRVYVVSRAANSVNFLKLRTAGSTNASILGVYVNASGVLSLRNDAGSQTVYSTVPVTTGAWHTVQVHAVINGSASSTEVWWDGVKVDALSLAQTTLGVTPIGRLQLGDNTGGRTYDMAFDDAVASTSYVTG
ncbi:MAG: fibronectin type III domain-containing protein [Frankiaceae bacterium]